MKKENLKNENGRIYLRVELKFADELKEYYEMNNAFNVENKLKSFVYENTKTDFDFDFVADISFGEKFAFHFYDKDGNEVDDGLDYKNIVTFSAVVYKIDRKNLPDDLLDYEKDLIEREKKIDNLSAQKRYIAKNIKNIFVGINKKNDVDIIQKLQNLNVSGYVKALIRADTKMFNKFKK